MSFFDRFRRKPPLYSSGSGRSIDDAIIINTTNHSVGVRAEYEYVSRHHGRRQVDWTLERQELTDEMENGRRYDILKVRLKSGEVKEIYFDITQFFGRF